MIVSNSTNVGKMFSKHKRNTSIKEDELIKLISKRTLNDFIEVIEQISRFRKINFQETQLQKSKIKNYLCTIFQSSPNTNNTSTDYSQKGFTILY